VKRRLLQTIVDHDSINMDLWCIDGTVVRAVQCAKKKAPPDEPKDHRI